MTKLKSDLFWQQGYTSTTSNQCLKGNPQEKDIIPYRHLKRKFGSNKHTLMECSQGYKYRYPKGVPTKVTFALTKPEEEEKETPSATTTTAPATTTAPVTATVTATTPAETTPHHNISSNGATTTLWSFSGPPTPPKVEIYLEKLAINAMVKII